MENLPEDLGHNSFSLLGESDLEEHQIEKFRELKNRDITRKIQIYTDES